jgi:imidazolonepropionase-like amidohydrolase
MQLDAWNWEDALVRESEGLFLYWPERFRYRGWWAEPGGYEANKDYDQQLRDIESLFKDGKSYMLEHDVFNARLDALRALWNGRSKLYIYADEAESILQAVAFSERFGLKPVICGGRDSWQIADLLAAKKISVVLQRVHALPATEDEAIDQPYRTAAILKKAGVEVALGCPGEFWQVRNLPFYAGSCAGYGLNTEEALALVTIAPARIMGLDKLLGSLEAGKEASIIVSSGDLLDMKSSILKYAFIGGREINLNNKQTDLYQLYMNKYKLKEE